MSVNIESVIDNATLYIAIEVINLLEEMEQNLLT